MEPVPVPSAVDRARALRPAREPPKFMPMGKIQKYNFPRALAVPIADTRYRYGPSQGSSVTPPRAPALFTGARVGASMRAGYNYKNK
eukprot:scaffold11586_cov94-Isochrysis_galbana.AAC.2